MYYVPYKSHYDIGFSSLDHKHRFSYMAGQHWFSHCLIWCWRRSMNPCGSQFGDAKWQPASYLFDRMQSSWLGVRYISIVFHTLKQVTLTADAYLIVLSPCLTISADQSAIQLDSCTWFNTNGFLVPSGHWINCCVFWFSFHCCLFLFGQNAIIGSRDDWLRTDGNYYPSMVAATHRIRVTSSPHKLKKERNEKNAGIWVGSYIFRS